MFALVNSCIHGGTRRTGGECNPGTLAPAGADFPAAITSRTANDGECTQVRGSVCWEPVCICFPAARWESETGVSVSLLVLFSSLRKAHIFFLWKGGICSFLVRTRKERKEAANVPFDRLCEPKTHLVGSHTKNPSNLYPFRFLCYSLLSVLCIFKKIQGNDTCLHS